MNEGHDFAWAIEQMTTYGRKVRRSTWWNESTYVVSEVTGDLQKGNPELGTFIYFDGKSQRYALNPLDTRATDWVLYDDGDSQDSPTTNLTFGQALELLKQNKRVAREGWNGKGQYARFVSEAAFGLTVVEKFLILKNAQGRFNTWVPSIGDLFSEDWMVVE